MFCLSVFLEINQETWMGIPSEDKTEGEEKGGFLSPFCAFTCLWNFNQIHTLYRINELMSHCVYFLSDNFLCLKKESRIYMFSHTYKKWWLREVIDVLTWWGESFHTVNVYQINKLYLLNILKFYLSIIP